MYAIFRRKRSKKYEEICVCCDEVVPNIMEMEFIIRADGKVFIIDANKWSPGAFMSSPTYDKWEQLQEDMDMPTPRYMESKDCKEVLDLPQYICKRITKVVEKLDKD